MSWVDLAAQVGKQPSWWHQHGDTSLGVGVGAAFAAVVAIGIYILQRPVKRIEWWFQSYTRLLTSPSKGLPDGVELSYYDTTLDDPRLAALHIQNTGNAEIRADEWDSPLTVQAMTGRFFIATVAAVSDPRLYPFGPIPIESPMFVEFDPVLLNRGD